MWDRFDDVRKKYIASEREIAKLTKIVVR